MKVSDLIWPDKWMPFVARFSMVIFAWVLWFVLSYLKFFVFQVDGVLQLGAVYPLIIIWCYLFNKRLPLPPASPEFDSENIGLQAGRSFAFVVSVIFFFGMLFIGDW